MIQNRIYENTTNAVIRYIYGELREAGAAKNWDRVDRLENWLEAEIMVQAVKDEKAGKVWTYRHEPVENIRG